MTSAPKSPRMVAVSGPAKTVAASMTRIPARAGRRSSTSVPSSETMISRCSSSQALRAKLPHACRLRKYPKQAARIRARRWCRLTMPTGDHRSDERNRELNPPSATSIRSRSPCSRPARADRRRDGRDAVPLAPSTRSSPRRATPVTGSITRNGRHARAGQGGPADLRRRHGLCRPGGDRASRPAGRSAPTATSTSSTTPTRAERTCPTSSWCGRSFATAASSAGWPRSATGTTSAATCPATTTRSRPSASRKEC